MEYFTLISPFTELYPKYNLSYFPTCSNNNYNNHVFLRLIVILLVWGSLAIKLRKINKNITTLIIALLGLSFLSRSYIERHTKYEIFSNLHIVAFILIYHVLTANKYQHTYSTIIVAIGGLLMNYGRKYNKHVDICGRIIFSIGFMLFSSSILQFDKTKNRNVSIILSMMVLYMLYENYASDNKIYLELSNACANKSLVGSVSSVNNMIHSQMNKKISSGHCDNSKYMIVCPNNILPYTAKYNNKKFFNIPYSYLIGSKYYIWKTLSNNNVSDIMPSTYIFPDDIQKYNNECKQGHKIIYKKLAHKQKGLSIDDKCKQITDKKIIAAQQYLLNSYTYKSKKINLRLYLIIHINKIKAAGYLSNDGIVSYTALDYDKQSNDLNTSVSSFYTSENHYENGYPITYNALIREDPQLSKIYDKCVEFTSKLFNAYVNEYNKHKLQINNNEYYEMFGVDYFISDEFDIKILEVNQGPGMTPFNEIDNSMRTNVINEYINLIVNNKINMQKL